MINKIDSQINKRLSKLHKAYAGVTGSNYNAIFSFKVFSGEMTEDQYGNFRPSASSTITIKAKIFSESPDRSLVDIGTNEVRDYYRAWFTTPLSYDIEIPPVLDCKILINGLWLEGKFHVVRNNISNQLENSNIRDSLGYAIEGTFESQGTQRA